MPRATPGNAADLASGVPPELEAITLKTRGQYGE